MSWKSVIDRNMLLRAKFNKKSYHNSFKSIHAWKLFESKRLLSEMGNTTEKSEWLNEKEQAVVLGIRNRKIAAGRRIVLEPIHRQRERQKSTDCTHEELVATANI